MINMIGQMITILFLELVKLDPFALSTGAEFEAQELSKLVNSMIAPVMM
jgi:hypothetical protein